MKVVLDRKWKKPKETQFKGHGLITTNTRIENSGHTPTNTIALTQRFDQISFVNVPITHEAFEDALLSITPEQWNSFALYCNFNLFGETQSAKVPRNWLQPTPVQSAWAQPFNLQPKTVVPTVTFNHPGFCFVEENT